MTTLDNTEADGLSPAQELAKRTRTALQAKSAARHKCSSAKQEAENLRAQEESFPNRTLESLRNTYQGRAEELAQEAGECPRTPWGHYMEPHDIKVVEEGVQLTWDINGDYAPAVYVATWDALLTATNEEHTA
jgi:hypothetical protein